MSKPLQSWVEIAPDSDFSIHNLPYGIFESAGRGPRVGVAIGDQILDLAACSSLGLLDALEIPRWVFESQSLNELIRLGKATHAQLRDWLTHALSLPEHPLREHASQVLIPISDARMHLPVEVGDYTDFYSSIDHATNVGTMFRDPENALLPNWKHIPVGYHGRASSIIVSGTPIQRPVGQTMPADATSPVFGPSRLLDFELEMAFILGKDTQLGQRVSTAQAEDYIFGMVLFNDWSARDIQKWEYVPLGPFLAKSFASSISPWVVPIEALAPFKIPGPVQEPPVLPYLKVSQPSGLDINLEVAIQVPEQAEAIVCRSNARHLYWSMHQQLAHHTVNGCNIRVGDMCASGTISGPEKSSFGSMLELSWRGTQPLPMPDGSERKFLLDYDTVIMRGHAEKDGIRVGFGEVRSQILPAAE